MPDYNSAHTGPEIDNAISRALPGGGIDQEMAQKEAAIESADYPVCYYRMVYGVLEWINPPMSVGVEYRTTERFFGRPVYYKIVDCGQIADNKQVEHGIANMRDCISFQGLRGGMPMPSISNNNLSAPWSYYVADVDRAKITLACGTSAAGGNCHVILKYTKTTD